MLLPHGRARPRDGSGGDRSGGRLDTLIRDPIRIIREMRAGAWPIPKRIALSLERRHLNASVTPREREVLKAPAEGMWNKETALALGITEETVYLHVRDLFQKGRKWGQSSR